MTSERELPVTERLTLRRMTGGDLDFLHRLNSDIEVMRYIGGPKTRDETEVMLKVRILGYYEQNPGLGVWITQERSSGASVGVHLLNHIQGESFIQVGYLLLPDYWNRGYATEMAVALVRYGFTTLQLPQIVGITDLPNINSQRVLIKAGLHRNGERSFAHPAYAAQGPLAWFERDAQSWFADNS